MARITIFFRSSKLEGDVNVRIRIRDTGKKTDIFHKTDIKASLHDLERLTPEGNKRPGIRIFNKELSEKIKCEIALCEKAFESLMKDNALMTGRGASLTFEKKLKGITNTDIPADKATFLDDFNTFIDDKTRSGEIKSGREKHYRVLAR